MAPLGGIGWKNKNSQSYLKATSMKILKNLFGKNNKIHVDEIAMKQGGVATLLSGAVIVESGSNSNGSYVKFGDGTIVAWTYALQLTYENVSRLHGTWIYPTSFPNEDVVVFATRRAAHTNSRMNRGAVGTDAGKFSAYVRLYSPAGDPFIEGDTENVRCVAIGR